MHVLLNWAQMNALHVHKTIEARADHHIACSHPMWGVCADVKNRRGNTARGRKITGMQFLPQDPSQLLITSNDSRVRLYEGEPSHLSVGQQQPMSVTSHATGPI